MTARHLPLATAVMLVLATPCLAQQGNPGAQMMAQWDGDADGKVTLEEAITKRGDVFYMFDGDNDGTLSAEDWAMVAEHMAMEMEIKAETQGQARANGMGQGMGQGVGKGAGQGMGNIMGPGAAMRQAMTPAFNDTDGDGLVTDVEFTAATQKLFPMLDRNGDGVLTMDDFAR